MISLIMATLGRRDEIVQYLDSLDQQSCLDFELIIVDQNPRGFLDDLLAVNRKYHVVHILSEVKGLSKNRNIGIEKSQGEILAFPDDDCVYYPDTVQRALEEFANNHQMNVLLGRIWDRESKSDIIKAWPRLPFHAKRSDLYRISSSITIFSRRIGIVFDESLGAGAIYPSNEDFDYIARMYEECGGVFYNPTVEVWHPQQTYKNIPLDKVYNYGRGFGRCARKLRSYSRYYLILFSLAIMFHASSFAIGLIFLDFKRVKYSCSAIFGRIRGLRVD